MDTVLACSKGQVVLAAVGDRVYAHYSTQEENQYFEASAMLLLFSNSHTVNTLLTSNSLPGFNSLNFLGTERLILHLTFSRKPVTASSLRSLENPRGECTFTSLSVIGWPQAHLDGSVIVDFVERRLTDEPSLCVVAARYAG